MICDLCGKPAFGATCIYCCKKLKKPAAELQNLIKDDTISAPMPTPKAPPPEAGSVEEFAVNYTAQNANVSKKSNGYAIAGFVLSFFALFFIFSLIFSIIGLNKSKELEGRGKGLAIAGIVITLVFIVGEALTIILNTLILPLIWN